MSLNNSLPAGSNPIQTQSVFEATFNAPTPNRYDFNTTANNNVFIHDVNKNGVYFMAIQDFSLTIPEDDFKLAIEEVPTLSFRNSKTRQQILKDPIPYVNYFDNRPFQKFYRSPQNADSMVGTFRGVLTQPSNLVGITTIKAVVQFVIYEVLDTNWIKNYLHPKGPGQGGEYILRGV